MSGCILLQSAEVLSLSNLKSNFIKFKLPYEGTVCRNLKGKKDSQTHTYRKERSYGKTLSERIRRRKKEF